LAYCYVQVFVIVEHKSNSHSYDGDVEDVSVDESGTDTSMSEVEITDSN
jgi:hypothetical protein